MTDDYLQRVLKARVYDVAMETSLDARAFPAGSATNLLKREDMQPVFSFKLRGAYNKIAQLSPAVAARGVICASAGNHAQGVALAARRRSVPAVIVMPETSPAIKVQAVIDLGGEVVLSGDSYDAAYERALVLASERSMLSCTRSTTLMSSPGRARSVWSSCARPPGRSTPCSCRWVEAA